LIRDDDLLATLDAGTIAAVGLDVFEHEPAIDPRYARCDRGGSSSSPVVNDT
jgi:phosphoglycerate dehydrogenase-like enzyme